MVEQNLFGFEFEFEFVIRMDSRHVDTSGYIKEMV